MLRVLRLDGFHSVPLYNNLKIEINLADNSENFYYYGCYPKHVVTFLKRHLKDADVFVDCGANFGLQALIASQYVKNLGRVHSYVPNPEMYYRLEKMLLLMVFRKGAIVTNWVSHPNQLLHISILIKTIIKWVLCIRNHLAIR